MINFTYPELQLIKELAELEQLKRIKAIPKSLKKKNTIEALKRGLCGGQELPKRDDKEYKFKIDQLATSMNDDTILNVIIRRIEDFNLLIKEKCLHWVKETRP